MSSAAHRPIAMFDSGFGGLTVARALIDLAPNEDLVYFGDTGRYPYGPRPHDEVRRYAHQITEWMVEAYDPKVVVVACNTATAVALDELQARFDVPVIGVVEPGLGAVLAVTDTDRVGVIGTVGTILGDAAVNIADMDVARVEGSSTAVMLIAPTERVLDETLALLRTAPGILDVKTL